MVEAEIRFDDWLSQYKPFCGQNGGLIRYSPWKAGHDYSIQRAIREDCLWTVVAFPERVGCYSGTLPETVAAYYIITRVPWPVGGVRVSGFVEAC